MSANWFVALPVSLELAASLAHPGVCFDFSVFAPPPCVRLFARSDLHITVAFLGRVSSVQAVAAFEAARIFSLRPQSVSTGPVRALGPAHKPSAFSALLDQGRLEVERSIGEVRDRVCDVADVARDPRPPLAHITLARPQRSASAQERAAAVRWAESLVLPALTARLTKLALYTWSADRRESLFRIERTRELVETYEGSP